MDRITLSLNRIAEYWETYYDNRYYMLLHKDFRNNLLMFKNDDKHKKTYMRLEQKLSSFLLNDSVAKRYIRYNGNQMITDDIQFVEIIKYSVNEDFVTSNGKFFKRPIPYAIVTSKKDMNRLLTNYLDESFNGLFIYNKFMSIEWENGMYFEMYRE